MKRKLSRRQLDEREFHDQWARSLKETELTWEKIRLAFESVSAVDNRYALGHLKPIAGKRILDLGCGVGEAGIYMAKKGARVQAVDISPEMVKYARRRAARYGVSIRARVMVAEALDYTENSFDGVFGNGILHHTDYRQSLKEVYRVLKPGGVGVFVEPLAHNPVINLYRRIAQEVRTADERPFSWGQIEAIERWSSFRKVEHKEFYWLTLSFFGWYFLVDRVNPNKERYWKRIVYEGEKHKRIYHWLFELDRRLLAVVPRLRKYCWNSVIVVEK